MEIGDLLRVCEVYGKLGGAVQEQFQQLVEANETSDDKKFRKVFYEGGVNWNAARMVADALKEMANIFYWKQGDFKEFSKELEVFSNRIREGLAFVENEDDYDEEYENEQN